MSQKFGRGFGLEFSERHAEAPTPPAPARDLDQDLPENRPVKNSLTPEEHALIRQRDVEAALLRKAQEDRAYAEALAMAEKLKGILNSGGGT